MIERRTLIGAVLAALASTGAGAQSFPSRPIRWIIPFAAGEAIGRRLGQTVVIDNRPGAGGVVGLEMAANAPADGYTVTMGSITVLWVAPYLAGRPPMPPLFAPVSMLTTVLMVVVARAEGRFADIMAALAEARTKPSTVTVGHAGNGTTNHVGILRLQTAEKVEFNVIPYKGSGPGLTDLLAGQSDLYVDQLTSSMPHIKAGKLKALLALGPDRVAELAGTPSLKDIGSQPFDGGTTAGFFTYAGTPAAVLDVLNDAVVAALKDGAVSRKLVELGAVVRPSTRAEFAAYLKDQEGAVVELVKSGLLKAE